MSIVDDIAYLETRLPFGVAAGPRVFSTVSEAVFDLVNDLLQDEPWQPTELHAPKWETFQAPPINDGKIPYAVAQPLSVEIP